MLGTLHFKICNIVDIFMQLFSFCSEPSSKLITLVTEKKYQRIKYLPSRGYDLLTINLTFCGSDVF